MTHSPDIYVRLVEGIIVLIAGLVVMHYRLKSDRFEEGYKLLCRKYEHIKKYITAEQWMEATLKAHEDDEKDE